MQFQHAKGSKKYSPLTCKTSQQHLPWHFSPCLTRPKSISPQKSQNVGVLYECTNSVCGCTTSRSLCGVAEIR